LILKKVSLFNIIINDTFCEFFQVVLKHCKGHDRLLYFTTRRCLSKIMLYFCNSVYLSCRTSTKTLPKNNKKYVRKWPSANFDVQGRPFLRHENGLSCLLDEILEGSPVRVGGEVVDGPVGGGVELERLCLVASRPGGGQQHLLGVLYKVLQARLRDNPYDRQRKLE
jgi:hypothetical protein